MFKRILSNLHYQLLIPFGNLEREDLVLLLIRTFTTISALALIIATFVGPIVNDGIYIVKINCGHLEVAGGLYKSLRSSVTSNHMISLNGIPVDSSLSNSEIQILTEYANSQVANAPQVVYANFWKWCYGYYNTTNVVYKNGAYTYDHSKESTHCSRIKSSYILDYRTVLDKIGFAAILAYAFQTPSYNSPSESKGQASFRLVLPAIIFTVVGLSIVLVLSYILYSNRGSERNLKKSPKILLHMTSMFALASCASLLIACSLLTSLIKNAQQDLSDTLGSFGITMHLGSVWFSLIWTSFVLTFLMMFSWVFPLWCNNPEIEYDQSEEYSIDSKHFLSSRGSSIHRTRTRSSFGVRSISQTNLYDDEAGSESSFDLEDSNSETVDSNRYNVEDKLRKLGRSLSKKANVRPTGTIGSDRYRKKVVHTISEPLKEGETRGLLYNSYLMKDSNYPLIRKTNTDLEVRGPFANEKAIDIQEPEEIELETSDYPGYHNNIQSFSQFSMLSNNRSDDSFQAPKVHERHFSHKLTSSSLLHPNQKPDTFDDHSILDGEDIKVLETHNNYINKF